VIHAAGVSEPRLMVQLTQAAYRQTIRAKVQGAWALHRWFQDKELDFFLLFSSVAAFAFTAGQADYAAANAFLDGLAHHRRARGLPATSINFGPWAEAGMATLLGDYFVQRGMTPFAPKKGLEAIEQLLQRDVAQATVLWISDRRAFRERNFSSSADIPFLDPLLEASPAEASSDAQMSDARPTGAAVLAALREAGSSEQRANVLVGYLQKLIGRVMRLGTAAVPTDQRLNDLGLDSLLAVEVKSCLTSDLGVVVPVMALLKGITIADLAGTLDRDLGSPEPTTPRARAADAPLIAQGVPLLPNQHWFFSRNLPNPHHWNMAAWWQAAEPLDTRLLEQALRAVLVHHDALRARFVTSEEGLRQNIVAPEQKLPLHLYDLSGLDPDQQDAAAEAASAGLQGQLHLQDGPLVRVAAFDFGGKQPPRLLTILHHLVSDVFSQKLVLSDLETAYRQLQSGRPVALPPKGASVADWVESLRSYVRSEASGAHRAIYRAHRWAAPAGLPVDFPARKADNAIGSARVLVTSLPLEETRRITNSLAEVGTRLQAALFTAFAVAVTGFSKRSALLADVIVHGRESFGPELDLARTVGLFAHGVPLDLQLPASRDLRACLRAVEQRLTGLADEGRSYAALRWLSDDAELVERMRAIPRRELVFNYIGHFEPADTENALFSVLPRVPSGLEPTDNPRDFVLQCQVGVLNGRLTVLWNYSQNLHRPETIERLGQVFLKALQELAFRDERSLASQA
jgi:non-ribosomal peptide synthase protein (TIGR01720 family)